MVKDCSAFARRSRLVASVLGEQTPQFAVEKEQPIVQHAERRVSEQASGPGTVRAGTARSERYAARCKASIL